MSTERLNIIVKLRNSARAGIAQVTKGLKGVGAASVVASTGVAALGTALLAIPGVVLAFAAAAIPAFSRFDDVMRQAGAVTNATAEELKNMTDVAKQMGATTRYTASEAADGLRLLGMAGFEAGEAVAALPGVLNLAAAGSLELSTAADIATNILSGFGLEVNRLGDVNDVLVKTFTSSNTTLVELGESFKLVGPIAKGVGADFEDLLASIGKLGDAGLKGTMSGTALRGAINALMNPTRQEAQLMKVLADRLGVASLQVKDAEGNFVGFAKIVEQLESAGIRGEEALKLFGQRAGPAMAALVGVGADSIREMTEELKSASGTADEISRKMEEGIGGSMRRARSAFEALRNTIGETFSGDAKNLIDSFTSGMLSLNDAIINVTSTEEWETFREVVGEVLKAIGVYFKALYFEIKNIIRVARILHNIFTFDFKEAGTVFQKLKADVMGLFFEVAKGEEKFYKIEKATGATIKTTQQYVRALKEAEAAMGSAIGRGDSDGAAQVRIDPVVEATLKDALIRLRANLAQRTAIAEANRDDTLSSINKYYDEREAIIRERRGLELRILQEAADSETDLQKRETLDARIYAKAQQLQTDLIRLTAERVREVSEIEEEAAKEALKRRELVLKQQETVNDLRLKAEKAFLDQKTRLETEAAGLQGEFAREQTAIQERQSAELAAIQEFHTAELELLRNQTDEKAIIREKEKEQALAIRRLQLDQEAEMEKLAADQTARVYEQKLENMRLVAQGASDIFQQMYEITGNQSKEFFYLAKAAAIAEATMNVAQGVTKAIAQGGMYGIISGATVAAAGAIQIAKIASQSLAEGGEVGGVSPSSRADDKIIRATSGEFMQPVSSVNYYGKGVMEAIRRRSIPREALSRFSLPGVRSGSYSFAEGGMVSPPPSSGSKGNDTTNIINVLDPAVFQQWSMSSAGQRNIINAMSENIFEVRQMIFDNQG
jgi:TP901 family phage tail tape measure protein